MRTYTETETAQPRFESALPKDYFNSPKPAAKPKPADWHPIAKIAIVALAFVLTVQILHQQPPATAPVAAPERPAPAAATIEQPVVEVRRAEVVAPPVGAYVAQRMPDGTKLTAHFLGTKGTFGQLPKNPQFGDMWRVTESGTSCWIWYTPIGFTHPAWVDP